MGLSTASANALLAALLQGTTFANVVENASSSPITSWYFSLHTTNPGAAGNQSTNEAAYTGYARVAVVRTSSGFTIPSGGVSDLVAAAYFPTATGGSETETYAGIGTLASGAGVLLASAPLSSSITVTSGVQPFLNTSTSITLS